jgi:predicted nucleotidyltransferase
MKQLTQNILNEITRRIREAVDAEKIILFGSWAWCTPDESSDLDLFVVVPRSTEPSYRRARLIYRCLRGIGMPVDVIVQTHEEMERSRRVATSLTKMVLEKGKLLYG